MNRVAEKLKDSDGYVWVFRPNHPKARADGYVLEHSVVMEEFLKVPLPAGANVHHRNRKRHDNRVENLLLMRNYDEHMALHRAMDKGDTQLVVAYEAWTLEAMAKLRLGASFADAYRKEPAPVTKRSVVSAKPKVILRRSKAT